MQEEVLQVKARCRYPSFAFDITRIAAAGENEIVVCVKDDNRSGRAVLTAKAEKLGVALPDAAK